MPLPRPRAWLAFLLAGTVALALYFVVPSDVSRAVIYDGLSLAAVVAIIAALRSMPAEDRRHWTLIGAAAAMALAGNVTWDLFELVLHQEPFPSVADVFFLAEYPLLAAGFLVIVRLRTGGKDRATTLDTLIVSSGAAALAWVFLVVPATEDSSVGLAGQLFAGAYPLMDVVLLATLVRLALGPGVRSMSYGLLVLSVVGLLVADAAFGVLAPLGLYYTGHPIDAGWLGFSVALGAAALHPSYIARRQTTPVRHRRGARMALVVAAALMGPGALVVQHLRGASSLPVILVGSGTIVVLILVRIGEQLRTENELRRTLNELHEINRQRELLVDRLVNAQEEERKLMAREIHDDPIQKMVAVRMRLDLLRKKHPDLDTAEDFAKLTDAADRTVKSLRHLMFELRPYALDTDGLAEALRLYLEEQAEIAEGTDFELKDNLESEPREEIRTVLYRVAQEAVTNARKHAKASTIRVILEEGGDRYVLRVVDDGVGFQAPSSTESAPGHLGLTSMRERADMVGGHVELITAHKAGTMVTVWAPRPRVQVAAPQPAEAVDGNGDRSTSMQQTGTSS
jgi:signal transduction histidine kinase